MEHVTTLTELEAQMARLIATRNEAIRAAERLIEQANRDFDAVAVPLGREINKVRRAIEARQPAPTPRPTTARTRTSRKVKVLAGLDDDEQKYYETLRKRKNSK